MRAVFFLLFIILISQVFPCTTFLVTKGATQNGSCFVGHTEDDNVGDQRIIRIPPRSHSVGSKKAIYFHSGDYPREVSSERSPFYDLKNFPKTKPTGYIDEVPHTYGYIEGGYSIMNEHQVALGEATNASKYTFEADPNKRIFEITSLMILAMERAKTAKEAILVMGEIAEKYGYYGDGETLPIGDKEEGWVFEISSPPSGEGAIWVAKKIPDGEIFFAANQFRIQDVDPKDPNILFSKNLFSIAKQEKWLDNRGVLNWVRAVSAGEFHHPYYSLRRVWRLQSLVAPSKNLKPYVEGPFTTYYPFSIKPDKLLTLEDALNLFRDHYEGTKFDLTKGLAAGPFGSPHRYQGNYEIDGVPDPKTLLKGAWERPISTYFTGYGYVAEIRNLPDPIGGIIWLGFDEAATTCYMPIYIGVLSLSKRLEIGTPQKLDRNFAWWPFNIVNNWITNFYSYASLDVLSKQKEIEKKEMEEVKLVDKKALDLYQKSPELAKKYLTRFCKKNVNYVVTQWWELHDFLIEKYTDGYINKPTVAQKVGYPEFWLNKVGYSQGPTTYLEKK